MPWDSLITFLRITIRGRLVLFQVENKSRMVATIIEQIPAVTEHLPRRKVIKRGERTKNVTQTRIFGGYLSNPAIWQIQK